ncbi:MAG: prepilin-type N-terminal cleavage/methylation domain-containing protein [Rubrivivax sp.]|nr:prepilin-type N-terminal cleavage/methylation domain-containing protein [Rubrivivax sp.]
MPTSGPGSDRRAPALGFTLIELLVVIAILALTASLVAVALRDGDSLRLEREAERLALLLETGRAESRASGQAVWWVPAGDTDAPGFRFVGLAPSMALPAQWLDPEVRAVIDGAPTVLLGPEALIAAQRVQLSLGQQRLVVATDGLGPFAVQADAAP